MPAVTTSYAQGRRRESTGNVHQSPTHLAGCIKWLPPKDKLTGVAVDIEDGCFNHPVMILSPQVENGKVTMLIMTSFGGVTLETRHASNRRAEYLPIEPSDPHPDNGILLRLRDGSPAMHKKSYVHTERGRSVPLVMLRPYRRQNVELYLSPGSYRDLVDYAGFDAPAPHPRARAVSYSGPAPAPAPASSRRASTPVPSYAAAACSAPVRAATPQRPPASRVADYGGEYAARAQRQQQDLSRIAYLEHVAAVHARAERQPLLPAGGSRGGRGGYDYGGHPAYGSTTAYGSAGPAARGSGSGAGDGEPFDWAGFGCLVAGVSAFFAVGYWLSRLDLS